MPDTVILDTLKGLFEEADEMDARDFRDWLTRMETKLDEHATIQAKHGERLATVEAKATASHRRLDELKVDVSDGFERVERRTKGPGLAGWAGIIAAALAGIAGIIAAIKGNVTAQAAQAAATHAKEGK